MNKVKAFNFSIALFTGIVAINPKYEFILILSVCAGINLFIALINKN